MISDDHLSEDENVIVCHATETALNMLRKVNPDNIDSIALIMNDFEGAGKYSVELWINTKSAVEQKVSEGIPQAMARWLYEHWNPNEEICEVIGESHAGPSLTHWKISADRKRLYSVVVTVAHRIRQQVTGLGNTPILVDNNHEYDELVFRAVKSANPDGQASDWLAKPPPECE